ncbi:MAG: hypothetical protein VKP70_09615 [Cyanobacteriota bacterium]|nr:hypothetical protein [Cyanobacteriota bacterium]
MVRRDSVGQLGSVAQRKSQIFEQGLEDENRVDVMAVWQVSLQRELPKGMSAHLALKAWTGLAEIMEAHKGADPSV